MRRFIIPIIVAAAVAVDGFGPGATSRVFLGNPQVANIDPKKPKLILIGGCPGTGMLLLCVHAQGRGIIIIFE